MTSKDLHSRDARCYGGGGRGQYTGPGRGQARPAHPPQVSVNRDSMIFSP